MSFKGRILSAEHKMKISMAKKGMKQKPQCGFQKGHKHSEETLKKMSESHIGLKSGEKHPRWMGGVTTLHDRVRKHQKMREWRNRVYDRDLYTCQECGVVGGELNAHHIIQLAKILDDFLSQHPTLSIVEDKNALVKLALNYKNFWDTENGITLCVDCHKKIEVKKYGKWYYD